MKILVAALFCLFLLPSCIGGVSEKRSTVDNYYEERRKSFDILTLVDTLMGSSGGTWSSLSNIRQIDWASTDIQTPDPIYESPYSRVGKVHVTMDSSFTDFKSDKRETPVKWDVILSGPRIRYSNLILRPGMTSAKFDGFREYFKKKGILSECYDYWCDIKSTGCYFRNMTITIHGNKYTIVEENNYALTGGPSFDLTFCIAPGWDSTLRVLPVKMRPKKLVRTEAN